MRVKNPSSTSQLNKMTVKELKAELEKLGKSTAGLKADLVARLAEAQRENQTVCFCIILKNLIFLDINR